MYNQLTRHILLYDCTLEELLDYYDDGLDYEVYKAEILIGKLAEAMAGKKGKKGKRVSWEESIDKYGNAVQKKKLADKRKKEEEE